MAGKTKLDRMHDRTIGIRSNARQVIAPFGTCVPDSSRLFNEKKEQPPRAHFHV